MLFHVKEYFLGALVLHFGDSEFFFVLDSIGHENGNFLFLNNDFPSGVGNFILVNEEVLFTESELIK